MEAFNVLRGGLEIKENRRKRPEMVKREAFDRMICSVPKNGYLKTDTEAVMKVIYYAINMISMRSEEEIRSLSREYLQVNYSVCDALQEIPVETFVRWFPIEKTYDGERWGVKDYYYTVDQLHGMDKITKPYVFLMDYQNKTVIRYMVNVLCALSAECTKAGVETPMEQFCEKNGVTVYRRVKLGEGKYLFAGSDGSQQILRDRQPNPAKLRVVPGQLLH